MHGWLQNMARALIGVTTSVSKGRLLWYCIQLAIWLAGGKARRITALEKNNFQDCDGFIISGGVDIDPDRYGQENTASLNIEPGRDELENRVIKYALKTDKPLVGICRGMQMINIVLGGTLHQEARDIYSDFLPTTSFLGKVLQRRKITITQEGKISDLFGLKSIAVNSIHHQSIAQLGSGLVVSACDRHSIPQAIESTDCKFIIGVQWHPELMLHVKQHRQFFKKLIQVS